jgi:hypothetical protein
VIKSIKRRWARKCKYGGKIQHLEDLDGKMILKWIFNKFVWKWATEFISLRVGQMKGSHECCIEFLVVVKCREFLYWHHIVRYESEMGSLVLHLVEHAVIDII